MSDIRLYRVMRDLEGKHCGNEYLGTLVTCGECKWAKPNRREGDYDCKCHIPTFRVRADDFCSRGERKGE